MVSIDWTEKERGITITRTWVVNSTSSTDSTEPTILRRERRVTHTYDTSDYRNPHIMTRKDYEDKLKKIKELHKKEMVLKMKKTWNKEIIEPPIKPIRPTAQLRGVCFSGRGWA